VVPPPFDGVLDLVNLLLRKRVLCISFEFGLVLPGCFKLVVNVAAIALALSWALIR
jgi:uncharacterized membrane protein YvlD (DUF360 family)